MKFLKSLFLLILVSVFGLFIIYLLSFLFAPEPEVLFIPSLEIPEIDVDYIPDEWYDLECPKC